MNEKPGRNTAASVRQRLLNLAHERDTDFGLILTNFAIERFLYRLSVSSHDQDFVIKGAVLFRVWSSVEFRPTKDLDMLAFGSSDLERVEGVVREICEIACEEDGLAFSSEGGTCFGRSRPCRSCPSTAFISAAPDAVSLRRRVVPREMVARRWLD